MRKAAKRERSDKAKAQSVMPEERGHRKEKRGFAPSIPAFFCGDAVENKYLCEYLRWRLS